GGHPRPRGQSEGETLFDVLVDAGKRAMFDFLRDTLDGDGDSGTNRHALAAGELVTASVPSGAAHPMYDSGNSCGEFGVDTNTSAPPGREKGHVTDSVDFLFSRMTIAASLTRCHAGVLVPNSSIARRLRLGSNTSASRLSVPGGRTSLSMSSPHSRRVLPAGESNSCPFTATRQTRTNRARSSGRSSLSPCLPKSRARP